MVLARVFTVLLAHTKSVFLYDLLQPYGNVQHSDCYLPGFTGDVSAGWTTVWRRAPTPSVKSISGNALTFVIAGNELINKGMRENFLHV